MLRITETLPQGFLTSRPEELLDLLGGPTLIHLPGRRSKPLFVSILLHGNETTGLFTIQNLLRRYEDSELPRSMSILVGNVKAAARGLRRLDTQPDYNRIWNGGDSPEQRMASQVLEKMRQREVFASVDIHNNTGINPHYCVVTSLKHQDLQMATLFSRIAVLVVSPDTTSTRAFSYLCPAVTLESGLPGKERGTDHVLEYIDACLHLDHVPDTPVHEHDLELYRAVAVVKVSDGCSIGFDGESQETDIVFPTELDRLNFRELREGICIARIQPGSQACLTVTDEAGKDVSRQWFSRTDGHVCTAAPLMPAMLTKDARIIRQDCLCYLMSRVSGDIEKLMREL